MGPCVCTCAAVPTRSRLSPSPHKSQRSSSRRLLRRRQVLAPPHQAGAEEGTGAGASRTRCLRPSCHPVSKKPGLVGQGALVAVMQSNAKTSSTKSRILIGVLCSRRSPLIQVDFVCYHVPIRLQRPLSSCCLHGVRIMQPSMHHHPTTLSAVHSASTSLPSTLNHSPWHLPGWLYITTLRLRPQLMESGGSWAGGRLAPRSYLLASTPYCPAHPTRLHR